MDLKSYIRIISDFPKPGISFKDITPLLNNGQAYKATIEAMHQFAKDKQIDLVAGPEARGFVIGAPLALSLGAGFIPIRKSGKLPGETTIEAGYNSEYGKDMLAVHKDMIQAGQKVLIADDLLATGGTISTSIDLISRLGCEVVGAAFLIELVYLSGREKLGNIDIFSLIQYEQ